MTGTSRMGAEKTWEVLFELPETEETPDPYWLIPVSEKMVARFRYWLYITNAVQREQEVHCEVLVTGVKGLPGIPTWLYVQGLDRPWIIGSLENSLLLFDDHYLDPGSLIRFRCEHINRVLLTQD